MADKKEFRFFVLSEYEEEEKYLCDMAKQGYLLEKVTLPGIYHFKKREPINMIYRIDFNPQKRENRAGYLQMFKDYGWDYLQDLNEFSYFYKLEADGEDEIFSDNASRIEMLERINNRKMKPILALFLCCVIPQGMRMMTGGKMTDPVSLAFYVLWIALIGVYSLVILKCARGFKKLRRKYDI